MSAARGSAAYTYSCGVCVATFPDNGEAWINHVRGCVTTTTTAIGQFHEDHERDRADPEYAEAYRQATKEVTTTAAASRNLDHGFDVIKVTRFARTDTLRTGRNYLRQGDPCRVDRERGVFRFVAVVTNTATGSVWAEVVGPAANPRTRSFRTERLRRVRRDTPTR